MCILPFIQRSIQEDQEVRSQTLSHSYQAKRAIREGSIDTQCSGDSSSSVLKTDYFKKVLATLGSLGDEIKCGTRSQALESQLTF